MQTIPPFQVKRQAWQPAQFSHACTSPTVSLHGTTLGALGNAKLVSINKQPMHMHMVVAVVREVLAPV
mgnify:CR=1 FL=1